MSLRRLKAAVPIALAVALLGALLVLAASVAIDRSLTLYPTPEMQTVFMRTYTPEQVLARFINSKYPYTQVDGSGSAAGRGFATHQRNFDYPLILTAPQGKALIGELQSDMTSTLCATGARIESEAFASGIGFNYLKGKSAGVVTIQPLELIPNPERYFRQPLASTDDVAPTPART